MFTTIIILVILHFVGTGACLFFGLLYLKLGTNYKERLKGHYLMKMSLLWEVALFQNIIGDIDRLKEETLRRAKARYEQEELQRRKDARLERYKREMFEDDEDED